MSARTHTMAALLGFGILIAVIAIFGLVRYLQFAEGPEIILSSQTIISTDEPTIFIEGQVLHADMLHINGTEVTPTPEGFFTQELLVPPGYTIMVVEAQDKFGHTESVPITITYRQDS